MSEDVDKGNVGHTVSARSMQRIANAVRTVERNHGLPAETRGPNRRHPVQIVEGELLADLSATTDPNVPTYAQFQIKVTKENTARPWGNDKSPSIIRVYNRTTSNWSQGTIGWAKELYPGFWVFTTPSNANITHGIVHVVRGNGWYTIEKAVWTGDDDDACYDADGVPLPGASMSECDPCEDVSGEGTESCGLSIDLPTSKLTGLGVYVQARDCQSQTIPLVVGTDCLIANLGDVLGGTYGQSGGGSSYDDTTPIWQVLRGYQQTRVAYEDEYKCCDDGSKVLHIRTPWIITAYKCAPIICDDCPGESS